MNEPTGPESGSYESLLAKIAEDPEFRQRLLENAEAAIQRAGLSEEVDRLRRSSGLGDAVACLLTCGAGRTCLFTCDISLV